jgi:prepilin-type N-terminal cleavage/methylation domain-containing protein
MIHQQAFTNRRRSNRASQLGFTLIELLIVMAILGIITAAGVSTYARESRVTLVRQVATQLQADLEDLRSKTIRFSTDATFTLDSDTQYTLNIPTDGTVEIKIRTIPTNVSLTAVTGTPATLSYKSPLSQVSAVSRVYQVQFDDISLFVKVIGVTGRAVQSATN